MGSTGLLEVVVAQSPHGLTEVEVCTGSTGLVDVVVDTQSLQGSRLEVEVSMGPTVLLVVAVGQSDQS